MQLQSSSSLSTGCGTNIGFLVTSGVSQTLNMSLFDGSGSWLGHVQVPLGPYEFIQLFPVFRRVTTADVPDGFAVVSSFASGFLAYASVVDNRSGDPVCIVPDGH